MISAHPQASWPWQRMAPNRRPLMTMAFILISMSGLLSGLVLRPITQSLWPNANQSNNAKAPTLTQPPTATATSTVTAANFYIGLKATPNIVPPGGSFTATATAKLSSTGGPAQGVTGTLAISGPSVIPITTPTMTTDANGNAIWTITVPTELSDGAYTITVTGKWGIYGATWESSFSVHGN
jgi:hypothetical protein